MIARRIRDLGVYSEIITPKETNKIKDFRDIKGIILSGGPSTVTKSKFQSIPKEIFNYNILPRHMLWFSINCKVIWRQKKTLSKKREFGRTFIFKRKSLLTKNFSLKRQLFG